MNQKYPKPRAVRLGKLDIEVDNFIAKHNVKFSKIVKEALEEYLEKDTPKEPDPKDFFLKEMVEEFKKYRANLSRVGGNLNQLAYHFNKTGIVHDFALEKTQSELKSEFDELTLFFEKIEQMIIEVF